ncbi:hypothetical protein CPB84DRAFT_1844595 [Gymnopilus junonius]|uniref:Uncharacterized protein n=1 Tax=Gymnopilus junonius TaxID=109634 RepID=A0A9P5NW68_GYMJU|nr:hypothetical protein CPB84DRAFT_1844595 [Gymnopilus junonius]
MRTSDDVESLHSPPNLLSVADNDSDVQSSVVEPGEPSCKAYQFVLAFAQTTSRAEAGSRCLFSWRPVSPADITKLSSYAGKIGLYTLTDPTNDHTHSIHPGTFLRLQQLHYRFATGPLLPSLHSLRITGVKSSLDYLNVFLSPSLRSLKVTDVEDYYQTPIRIFLDNLLEETKDVTHITLGPGRISDDLL